MSAGYRMDLAEADNRPLGKALGLAGCSLLLASPAAAQILPDGSLGTESSVVVPGATIQGLSAELIEGGATRGANLFHSFASFNVNTGQRVYFATPSGIENILSRVTGGDVSNIDGLLGVDGGANLFLLNPQGVIFGPDARLDVSGSFMTSTADRLTFADGSTFAAVPTGNELLSVSVPLGVQFNDQLQGNIASAGALAVGAGESLTLLGDRVTTSGSLTAFGGTVAVLGNQVRLADQALIDVSSPGGGGTVLIGGDYQGQGTVPLAQQTQVEADVQILANALTNGDGGTIVVWAEESTDVAGRFAAQGGSQGGDGGLIETSGRQTLFVQDTAQVNTEAPAGQLGTWLLDPPDLAVVGTGGTATIGGGTNAPPTATSIDAGTVVAGLNGANVNLQGTNAISVNAEIDASANGSGGNLIFTAPTVNLNNAIVLFAGSTLSGAATTVNVAGLGGVVDAVSIADTSGAVVNLAAGLYEEGEPIVLDRNITLNGAGAGNTDISGSISHQVLQVENGVIATVNDLTIADGNAGGNGGGVLNDGTLTINNSVIEGNVTTNTGGGIRNEGTLTLNRSTVSGNQSGNSAGISNTATLTVRNSTISGNTATNSGGGIYNNYGTVTVSNSTISGNTAAGSGGGIRNRANPGTGNFTITSSLVSGNTASTGANISNDNNDPFTSGGNNLFGDSGVSGLDGMAPGASDIVPSVALSAILDTTLANNGGPTPTLALVAGSPAIDAGTGGGLDQRGFTVVGTRDIGAFEFGAAADDIVNDIDADVVPEDFANDEAFNPPEQTTEELPTVPEIITVLDIASERIQLQTGCGAGGTGNQSTFIITGSGGLPYNPSHLTPADSITVPWVIEEGGETSTSTAIAPPEVEPALVEARGFVTDADGTIYFIENPGDDSAARSSSPILSDLCDTVHRRQP